MTELKIDFLQKLSAYFDSLQIDLNGKGLCVCLSGGADSVSLLRGLVSIASKYGFNVFACHFNHLIRGEEANRDENFCKELCENLGIKIFRGRDDVPEYAKYYKLSLEEAARDCRYAFFKRVCERDGVDYCVTAHNMNDDAETLLFNLIRGTGLNGATAIAPHKDKILRPLLKIKRSEIEAYLGEIGQSFVTDSTNQSLEYSRNFIRHKIIPDMETLNPSVVEALSKYIEVCRNDREYFDEVVDKNLDSNLFDVPKAIRDRVIIKKYKLFCGGALNYQMISDIEKAIISKIRTIIPLYSNTEAIIEKGNISFNYRTDTVNFMFDPVDVSEGENSLFGDRVTLINGKSSNHFENVNKISITDKLSFDNMIGGLKVRNRRVGDKIFIHGMHKSLKKLFIEKKIPKEYRDIIPIIFDDEGIIYVPFVGIADRAYPKSGESVNEITTFFNTIDTERWMNAYEK